MTPPPRTVILDLGNVLVFHDIGLLYRRLGAKAGLTQGEVEHRLAGASWTAANRGLLGAEGIRRGGARRWGWTCPPRSSTPCGAATSPCTRRCCPRVEGLVGG
jgi:putative hydrolase of the HAD superfamily